MSREKVVRAAKHFGVPSEKEEFLFLLPGLYVGAADGKLDNTEILANIAAGAAAIGILGADQLEPKRAAEFFAEKIVKMVGRCDVSDLQILMEGIQAKLQEMPAERAGMVKAMLRLVISRIAETSGRKRWILWGSQIDKSEAQMISLIASYL